MQKVTPPFKRETKIRPRLGQERAGIKCKKPQVVQPIDQLTDKLQEMPKIPTIQIIAKNRKDFPTHKQSISNSSTEVIT